MPRQKKQHLKKRKDGRYCCVYHGVQFMGWTEDEVFEKRREYQRQEALDAHIAENPNVREFAKRWLKISNAGIREVTQKVHALHLRHLCDVIGNMDIRDVKPLDIKRVYTEKYGGKSRDYITHARALFNAMFAAAVEDGLLRVNPALSDTAKPHKGSTGGHRAITAEERSLIETVATDHRMHAPAIVMLYAGLRPQEVKSLKIDRDVDFDKGIIHVRSFVHLNGNHYEVDSKGKTEKATRDVPLFAPVRKVLQGRKGYLIADKEGNVATRMAWQRGWRAYKNLMENHINGMLHATYGRIKKEKPPWKTFDVVPYDLRHSFATWCRDNGIELHTCVEWMGHSDAQMILKIYDEVTDSRSKSEAERLEKMLIHMQNDMQKQEEKPGDRTESGLTDGGGVAYIGKQPQ